MLYIDNLLLVDFVRMSIVDFMSLPPLSLGGGNMAKKILLTDIYSLTKNPAKIIYSYGMIDPDILYCTPPTPETQGGS